MLSLDTVYIYTSYIPPIYLLYTYYAKAVRTQFWGCHQRFFRQLCMAMKIPATVEIATAALREGKCALLH